MILIMKSKTYHHGNLKEALISAGLEILSEKGMEGLSLRNVAKQIGVSHAAPYNHFHDKQALLAAMSTVGGWTIGQRGGGPGVQRRARRRRHEGHQDAG